MSDSERLVRVYATGNAFDGLLTKGHLEAEGITVLMKGESEGPYRAGPVYLWVTSGDEGRAREVIRAIESGAYATSDDDVVGGQRTRGARRRHPGRAAAALSAGYRLEYWGALRAFLSPYFRRSFSRASRRR